MKKTILTFILFGAMTLGIINAQNVNIPDANFKSCLVNNMLINTNGDNEIQYDEASSFTGKMDCSWAGANGLVFSNSTGMEAFTAMTELQLNSQGLITLDLTGNVGLEKVDVHQNFDLTSINITGLTNLTELKVFNTALPTLDVSTNSALKSIFCDRTNLTTVDASGLTNLEFIDGYNSPLSSLNLTGCSSLAGLRIQDCNFTNLDFITADNPIQTLWVGNNPLTTLEVGMLDSLSSIWVQGNDLLTSIDLSKNTALVGIRCHGNALLENLNIANTTNEDYTILHLFDNPKLDCIQVDDVDWSNDPVNWDITKEGGYGFFYFIFDADASFGENCGAVNTRSLENLDATFSVFPNPTSDRLTVDIEAIKVSQIEIIDVSGKTVRTFSENRSTIDVSNLSNGIYFIQVKTKQGFFQRRFIKT